MKAPIPICMFITYMVSVTATNENRHFVNISKRHLRTHKSVQESTKIDAINITTLPKNLPYNGTLYKCRCDGNQAWDGLACVDAPSTVVVFEAETGRISRVDIGHFQEVTVGKPQCPSGNTLATLNSSHDSVNHFSLLPSGHLYWHKREFQFYCIDHMLKDDTGETPWLLAHVCLSPPSVPRCCPPGRALTDDFSCSGHTSQVLAPPIMVDGLQVQWPGESPSQVEDVTCSHHQDLLTIELTSSVAFLNYTPDRVSLVWSPFSCQWKEQENGYCVGVQEGREDYLVQVCHEDVRGSYQRQYNQNTCVRKCCPEYEILNGTACRVAKNDNELWKPLFYNSEDLLPYKFSLENVTIIPGFPVCEREHIFQLQPHFYEDDEFLLLDDGTLYVINYQDRYQTSSYCIDNYIGRDSVVHTQALLCFQPTTAEPVCDAAQRYVYPVLLLVSSGFLGITLVIYASIPDLRNKLHGKYLISLVSTLLVGYISLSIVSLAEGKMPTALCRITASVLHLTFLAGFFWLNTMCFDIWRTLSKMRTVSRTATSIRRRFLLCSLYSWGCPLIITIVAVIIEALPESPSIIRPNFGTDYCFFTSEVSLWVYFYGYVLVLVLANMVFLGLVLYSLCSQDRLPQHRRWDFIKERLWLYVKLFLVMGITWLAEVISWQEGTCQAWIVMDVINSLQGLIIFLIFVCKRSTLHLLRARWATRCGRTGQFAPITSVTSFKLGDSGHYRVSQASLDIHRVSSARDSVAVHTLRNTVHHPDTHNPHHHHYSQPSTTDSEREDRGRKREEGANGGETAMMNPEITIREDLGVPGTVPASEATPLTDASATLPHTVEVHF